jgi:hypothetical protein
MKIPLCGVCCVPDSANAIQVGKSMDVDPLVIELRRFILTYAEHDSDCPGIDANAWHDQKKVCVCGLTLRLDELLAKVDERLA